MGHSIVFVEKWLDETVILFAIFEDWRRLFKELLPSSRLIPHYLVAVVEGALGCFVNIACYYNCYFCYNYNCYCCNHCYSDSDFDNLCDDHFDSNDC